jgi:hypothetical protein
VTGFDIHVITSLQSVVEIINSVMLPSPLRIDTKVTLANLNQYAEEFKRRADNNLPDEPSKSPQQILISL